MPHDTWPGTKDERFARLKTTRPEERTAGRRAREPAGMDAIAGCELR